MNTSSDIELVNQYDFRIGHKTLVAAPWFEEIHMGGPLPIGGAAELDLNGASDKLILDADGDTTISADTDDQWILKLVTDRFSIASTGATTNVDDKDILFNLRCWCCWSKISIR